MLFSTWRFTRFHVSYLIAWTALGILIGLLLGQYLAIQFVWAWVMIAIIVLGGAYRSRRWTACVLAVLAGGVLGVCRGSVYIDQLVQLDQFVGRTITVAGVISQDPVFQTHTNEWRVQLQHVVVDGRRYTGEIYTTVVTEKLLRRGDKVAFHEKARAGFGSFRLALYRAEIVQFHRDTNMFLDIRDRFATAVRAVMPEPEASLGVGFVVGQKSVLPSDLVEQLKIVGLTHIVVASGYNLTILVRFARRLLARTSRYAALVGSVLLTGGFVLLSGLSPSMNRAAVVTMLSLLAWYYGRRFHPLQLIVYVASVSAFLYPVYLWADLGWWLSFAAFFGILVVAPIVSKCFVKGNNTLPAVGRLVIETVSAEIMTLPIIVVYFGYIPVFALLTNVLVAPIIPFAMATTCLAGVVGMVAPFMAIGAIPASIVIAYVLAVVEYVSALSWAQVTISVPFIATIAWYGICGVWLLLIWRARRVDLFASSVVE